MHIQEQNLSEEEFSALITKLHNEIESDVQEDTVAREVLHRMAETVKYTYRTNLFLDDRYALAIRVDTKMFNPGNVSSISPTKTTPHISSCLYTRFL
jgi:glutamate dehydrogenase